MFLEQALIEYASPTLAGLKAGSLFTVPVSEDLAEETASLNRSLCSKGMCLVILRMHGQRALLYLYREQDLLRILYNEDTRIFLSEYGYHDCFFTEAYDPGRPETPPVIARVLVRLRDRIRESECFPHEIGIFLDYPLADVIGFIKNSGKNFLCCGCWKVYSDRCAALEAFARFKKCKAVYTRLFAEGRPMDKLMVAARHPALSA